MEQRPNIFEDDLVCLNSDKNKVGEVIRLGWVKCNDDHDNEDEHEEESDLEENLVLVGWVNGELTKEDPKNLTVLERYVSLGDHVQKVNDDSQILGTVTNISMYLDIENKKGVMRNVHCDNVKHIHPFQRDEFVVSKKGKWIGRVYQTICDVTILFEDGAACVITEADSSVLKVIGTKKEEEPEGEPSILYNPGDVVRATKNALKEANWINGKNNNKRGMATVIDVQPLMVFVDWFNNGDWKVTEDFPPGEAAPKEINMIDPFDKYNWGIGDSCFLRRGLEDSKEVNQVLKTEFEKVPIGQLKSKNNNNKAQTIKNFISSNVGKVVALNTLVDITWQDGTVSKEVSSTTIRVISEEIDKDLFPGQYVYNQDSLTQFGLVQKVNVKDLTCDVKWLTNSTVENDVPIFNVRRHPFTDFRLASCVIKLPEPQKKTPKNWCGFIVGTNENKVQVKWNSGELVEEDPNELMILPMNDEDDDDEFDMGAGFEGENEDGSQDEDDEKHNQSDFVFNFGESKVVKPTKLEAYNTVLSETDKLVLVLFGETWNMQCAQMMNTFDTYSNQYTDVTFVYVNVEEYKPAEANDSVTYPSFRVIHNKKVLSSFEGSDENQLKGEIERWKQTVNKSDSSTTTSTPQNNTNVSTNNSNDDTPQLVSTNSTSSNFSILSSTPTHHTFLVQQPEHKVDTKIVLKEYETLNTSLPKSVFVRVFESRVDILRVLIFAPENTPIAHTPFVFDIQVPSQYPTASPNVFFHSYVLERMNPNFCVDGRVCSSLVGTDEGRGEFWDSKSSNLLQLFTHLHTLLSESHPFFSDPEYEELKDTPKGNQSSKIFDENALILSLRNLIHNLKNNKFEEFKEIISLHLKEKRALILDNIRKYLGHDVKVENPIYSVPFEGTSVAFRKVLTPIYEELSKLFENL